MANPLIPPINFSDAIYLDETLGAVAMEAAPPLVWESSTHTPSIESASANRPGIVNTIAQTFTGTKTFAAAPLCSVAPSAPEALANKCRFC